MIKVDKFYNSVYYLNSLDVDLIWRGELDDKDPNKLYVKAHPSYEMYEVYIFKNSQYNFLGFLPYSLVYILSRDNLNSLMKLYYPDFDFFSEINRYTSNRIKDCIHARATSQCNYIINEVIEHG